MKYRMEQMRYLRIIYVTALLHHFLLLSLRQKIEKNLSSPLIVSQFTTNLSIDWAEQTLDSGIKIL